MTNSPHRSGDRTMLLSRASLHCSLCQHLPSLTCHSAHRYGICNLLSGTFRTHIWSPFLQAGCIGADFILLR